jgi:hypothetical protein
MAIVRGSAQALALKAYIMADSTLAAWYATGRMAEEVANALNLPQAPEWVVWKSQVSWADIMGNGMDWERVVQLTVGEARAWDWLFIGGVMQPHKINIRAGIDRVWSGTAPMLAVRATVYTHCKRAATRAEKALSTGTGTTASPATMGFEGALNYMDIDAAMAS